MTIQHDLNAVTWYHGTVYPLSVGDVLLPGAKDRNFRQSAKDMVSVTGELSHAAQWARKVAKKQGSEQIYIYRVRPLGKVHLWNFFDYRTPRGEYLRTAYFELRAERAIIEEIVFGEGIQHMPGDITDGTVRYRDTLGRVTRTEALLEV